LDFGGVPVILPPGPPLPVHAGRVLLDQTYREVPNAGAEERGSFRLACETRTIKGNTNLMRPGTVVEYAPWVLLLATAGIAARQVQSYMTELHERNFRGVYLALIGFTALDVFA
jgi:hypothetical protein